MQDSKQLNIAKDLSHIAKERIHQMKSSFLKQSATEE
jgi:hypothetical protein